MKLSKRKAVKLHREVWNWCAETGGNKRNWPNGGCITSGITQALYTL